jgi:hypothetical protein
MSLSHLVTVRTFINRIEAELARSALAAAGVDAVLQLDDCGGVRPSLWLTGIDLLVRPEDYARAAEVLDLPALQSVDLRSVNE